MENLQEVLDQMRNQNYFEVLGVDVDASVGEIRKARRTLLPKYHPDKFESRESKKAAEDISSLVNLAFEALSDSSFVEQYIATGFRKKYRDYSPSIGEDNAVKSMVKLQKKGTTLTATALLTPKQLREGGKTKIEYMPTPGKDSETDRTRIIDIPRNTKSDSIAIYEGLGEKVEGGIDGDLIVHFSTGNQRVSEADTLRSVIASPVVSMDILSITGLGVNKIDAPKVMGENLKIELFKENTLGHILYIKEAGELNKGLMLYY